MTTSPPPSRGSRTSAPGYNQVFSQMATAGVSREGPLHRRGTSPSRRPRASPVVLLSMRDDAFGQLNGGAPKYTITDTSTTDLQPGIDEDHQRHLRGSAVPDRRRRARIPHDVRSGQRPTATDRHLHRQRSRAWCPSRRIDKGEAFPVVYGHGLLGSADEVTSSDVQTTAATINGVYCATDWIGLAEEDLPRSPPRPSPTCRTSRASPTAFSRESSTRCSSVT